MERSLLKPRKFISLLMSVCAVTNVFAASPILSDSPNVFLKQQPGFLRFSYDQIKMPNNMHNMGLLGITYFSELNPILYGGIGMYGSITGTQGGLFVLGFSGGLHHQFGEHWWGDAGLFLGGGGGRSSLVGGGLMIRPHIGVEYEWRQARIGLHYSYISFPSGLIRSHQLGLDLDLPFDFSYINFDEIKNCPISFSDILVCNGKYLDCERNDFAIILQAYRQNSGTRNVDGEIQNGVIQLVGAELDHYFTDRAFWWVKTSGAYGGIPNGYMDILGGLGYHWPFALDHLALVPQIGVGAGGGGKVDTGGGIIIQPQLGLELPLTSSFAARVSGGYLWAPKGELNAYTLTGALIYHLNIATSSASPFNISPYLNTQGWRIQLFNQTYVHPQRAFSETVSAINLIAVQIDQFFNANFFLSYQAAFAYQGFHAGGYATGMIGPGIQTPEWMHRRLQLFTELLLGAGGGGALALGGGALIEPVIGVHYAMTPSIGLQASVGQLKALRHDLNTTVFNFGVSLRFGTIMNN